MEQNFFQENDISAFLPECHKNIGEVTRVMVSKGEDRIVSVTSKSFRKNLCKYYSIDYESSRKKFGKLIGCTNCVPLPINSDKIFLQLKVRNPEFKNDSAMGYIDLNIIKELQGKKDKKSTDIILKDGRKLKVLYNPATIKRHIKNAKLIIEQYKKERGYMSYPEDLEKLYSIYDKPATKADIAILVKEIAILKDSLKVYC